MGDKFALFKKYLRIVISACDALDNNYGLYLNREQLINCIKSRPAYGGP